MGKIKAKKKNPQRQDLLNKKFTYQEVKAITGQIEESAIRKMTDACFFAHSLSLIVLQDQFGFGPKRRAKYIAAFNEYCRDYADGKFDYKDPIEIGNELESACKKLVEDVMRGER